MDTHWIERLSEYRDNELTAVDRAACEVHLAECVSCRGVLDELEMVVSLARLDEDRAPVADLWPGILAKIETTKSTGVREAGSSRGFLTEVHGGSAREFGAEVEEGSRRAFGDRTVRRWQVTLSLPQLALAASLLIAVSAAVAYVAAGRTAGTPPLAYETPILAVAELATAPATVQAAPANFADAQFDQAVADLERTLVEQRDELDPRTIMVIERNLRAIDEAIRQAREALDGDPSNTFLNSHLAEARKRKIELLRRATSIAGN
jgi:hypothetical protein